MRKDEIVERKEEANPDLPPWRHLASVLLRERRCLGLRTCELIAVRGLQEDVQAVGSLCLMFGDQNPDAQHETRMLCWNRGCDDRVEAGTVDIELSIGAHANSVCN